MWNWLIHNEFAMRLLIAAGLGLVLGIERELKRKSLGLKTSIVICVASYLLTYVSIEAAYTFKKTMGITMDPMRLAAQVISGVGFLGAGVILTKRNDTITGLTTSALIWSAAAMGIATGAGFYKEASVALFIIIISVELLPYIIKLIGPKSLREKRLIAKILVDKDTDLTLLLERIGEKDIEIQRVKISDDAKQQGISLRLHIDVDQKRKTTVTYRELKEIPNVKTVDIENI